MGPRQWSLGLKLDLMRDCLLEDELDELEELELDLLLLLLDIINNKKNCFLDTKPGYFILYFLTKIVLKS